jgi:hypothetical protein
MSNLEDLKHWNKFFRNQKADHLKTYRRYKKDFGKNDNLTVFMKGFAAGYTSPIMVMEELIKKEESNDGNI